MWSQWGELRERRGRRKRSSAWVRIVSPTEKAHGLWQREWLGGVGTQDVLDNNEERNGCTTHLSAGHCSQVLYICFGG